MLIRLRHTTTFRLTVIACLTFMGVGAAIFGFSYWSMLRSIDSQINQALARESADITAAYENGGYDGLRRTVAARASPQQDAARIYLLIGPNGALTGNLRQWPADAPQPGAATDVEISHAAKTARVRTLAFSDDIRVLVGRTLSERNNLQVIVGKSLVSVLGTNLLLGAAAGTLLALYARRRLGGINAITQKVLEGNLSERIAVGEGGDEYDHLAQNINAMLDRIQRLVATVRGVAENIAHDLRTPLNRLRGRMEVALMAQRTPDEYRGVLKRAIAESETIVDTFNGILKIARMKAGALDLPLSNVNLVEVVEELVDLYQVFAEESGVIVEAQLPQSSAHDGALFVFGEAHLISQAAANLLDNAIKYTPTGGKVIIAAAQTADSVSLTIADNGPGIPIEMRAAILDRYVRGTQPPASRVLVSA